MASFSQVVELLGKVALQMLPGIMLGGGNFSRAIEKAAAKKGLKGAAMTYPGLTHDFVYPITYVANSPTWVNNATVNENETEAGYVQSLEEHNRALMEGGEASEKALKSWWPNEDMKPRVNFTPGSSAVSDIKITTDNKILIQFRKNGKWYRYNGGPGRPAKDAREAAQEVMKLIGTQRSIGRQMNRNGRLEHVSPLDKKGHINQNVGAWARNHYDPTAKGMP